MAAAAFWRLAREGFSVLIGVAGAIYGAPAQASGFFVHLGATGLYYKQSAQVFLGGAPVPGAGVAIDPSWTVGAELGYFLTPNVAVAFSGGLPPSIPVSGAGTISGLGRLGSATAGPMAALIQYHLASQGLLRPYLGLGPAFMLVFDTKDGALTNLKVDNAVGFVGQVGTDLMINQRWGLFADLKLVSLSTHASGKLSGTPASASIKLDPAVVSFGTTLRF